jgi:hypothetical protein
LAREDKEHLEHWDLRKPECGCADVVPNGSEDCIEDWTRFHSCYILAKNLSTFSPYPEILWLVEFKSD